MAFMIAPVEIKGFPGSRRKAAAQQAAMGEREEQRERVRVFAIDTTKMPKDSLFPKEKQDTANSVKNSELVIKKDLIYSRKDS